MVKIDTEAFSPALFAELLPLAQKCWQESTQNKAERCAFYGERDFAIEPDVEQYQRLADLGLLVVVTLRDDGQVQGYAEGMVFRSMRHKKFLGAFADSMYLEPAYRSYTAVIAERFECEFAKLGAVIIGWPTDVNGPVYEVLKARGYVGDDIVMEKKLCASR